ncbi:MAG: hypothetical protein J4432_00300 [DPANN group archaeon]|nr:hypothetical protein [DPANN group archaeon]
MEPTSELTDADISVLENIKDGNNELKTIQKILNLDFEEAADLVNNLEAQDFIDVVRYYDDHYDDEFWTCHLTQTALDALKLISE